VQITTTACYYPVAFVTKNCTTPVLQTVVYRGPWSR